MKKILILSLAAFSLSTLVHASETWKCYQYGVVNLTAPDLVRENSIHQEHWCRSRQGNQEFLFNTDVPEPRAELAALLEYDSAGKLIALTHGSLNQGRVSIRRSLTPEVNPLPIPIDPDESPLSGHLVKIQLRPAQRNAALKLLARFQSRARLREATIAKPRVAEGTYESYLPDSSLPWRGYWWPMRNYPLARGSDSPLAKYDRIIQETQGYDPGSVNWEIDHHALTSEKWDGHCNGWAAATILYPEPRSALREPHSGIELGVSDLKGLLTEASFCVSNAFYGHRYNGPDDDPDDIYPDQFHKVLLYYIDGVKKPIAYDYERLEPIDNNVITGYHMEISKDPSTAQRFHIIVDLRSHRYDYSVSEDIGNAHVYTRTYEYYLDTDSDGNIVNGEWISTNPDFLWVPVSRATCAGENPGVTPDNILKIQSTSMPVDRKD